jgi:LmbE family N-acetylglucosaminyl deacetylase
MLIAGTSGAGTRETDCGTLSAGSPPCRHAVEEQKLISIDDPGLIAAVSPHLDDAVTGCGAALAAYPGCTVITVFAGVPEATTPLTDWDRRCGFGGGDAAMAYRLGEDEKALHLLKAQPIRLPFLDDQYVRAMERSGPKVEKIAPALSGALQKAQAHTVLFPIGLFHSDHILVSDAALTLFPTMADRRWIAYEVLYARRHPDASLFRPAPQCSSQVHRHGGLREPAR